MIYSVQRFTSAQWEPIAESAHKALFGVVREGALNRHHFVVAIYGDGVLGGYFTCLEMDSETVYIQYGGVFPNFEKTVHVVPGYLKMLSFLRANYKRASTKIDSKNIPMLKMALQAGFEIVGTSLHDNKLFIDLTNTF